MSHYKYAKPPIVEAVCEFQFAPNTPWDSDSADQIHRLLIERFPKTRLADRLNIEVSTGTSGFEQHAKTIRVQQYLQDDEHCLFQVSPYLLSVNHLAPYSSWDEFLPVIEDCYSAYRRVTQPQELRRVELRYINNVIIPEPVINLEDYFNYYPHTFSDEFELNSFIIGVTYPQAQARDTLRIEMTSMVSIPDTSSILLDLDYWIAHPSTVPLDDVQEWINTAHNGLEVAFESCIKDSLRSLFEEKR